MKGSLVLLCGLLTGFTSRPTRVNAQTQIVADDQKLAYPYTFAPSEGLANQTEKGHRQKACINGYQDFQFARLPKEYIQGKGITPELLLPENDNEWGKTRIRIPSPWSTNAFAYRGLEGPNHRNYPLCPKGWEQVKMVWMEKNVTILAGWSGQQVKPHFEAVAGYSEIYINKEKIGENFDLFLPFSFDIADKMATGESIGILVGV